MPAQNSRGFIERTAAALVGALDHAFYAEELARAPGLLQRLDPRMKLLGALALIVAVVEVRRLTVIGAIFLGAVIIAALSRIPLRALFTRVWLPVLCFTGVIALPAIFITPGQTAATVPALGWVVTRQGLRSAAYLVGRAETAATLCVLVILTTPWASVLKALRALKAPAALAVLFGMTYRYLFLLLESARDMFESRRSRIIGRLSGPERRRVAAASAGVLISKSFDLSSEVYSAMVSRGFRGEARALDEFESRPPDWIMLAACALIAAGAFWMGR